MERINRSLVMRHAYLACALGEQMESGKTPSSADGVLHHPPEACHGGEGRPTMGREAMAASLVVVVSDCRIELVRPRDPAAIDDQHALCAGFAAGGPHLMQLLAQLLGIKVRHNVREDFGGARLDRPTDAAQDPAGQATPRSIPHPRLACEGCVAFDLALAQRPCGKASARCVAPPPRPRERKAPEDGFVVIEHQALAPARAVLQGGKCDRALGKVGRGGSEPPGGAAGAQRVFFQTPRTRARPRWPPVWWASTSASSRHLHWEWMDPCCRGA
jgi:hypothetical protein